MSKVPARYCDVFLSATAEDAEIAAAVQSELENAGLSVFPFWDPASPRVSENSLRRKLLASGTLVAVVTKAALGSPLLKLLFGAAWALDKPVHILLHGVRPEDLNVFLRRFRIHQLSALARVSNEIGTGAKGKTA